MSRNDIDNILHRVRVACIVHSEQDAERIVYDAIEWYIETGRASVDWIQNLANKRQYKGLITSVMKSARSTEGVIRTVTQLLNTIAV